MVKDQETFRHEIFSSLKKDKLYDKKSLIWENGEIREVADDMDSNTIQEGRLGEFPIKVIRTKMGVTISLPLVANNKTLDYAEDSIDDQNIYQLRSENRILKLEKLLNNEYQDRIQNNDKTKDLYKIPMEDKENYLFTYEGLIDSDKYGTMLGTIVFFKGKSGDIYEFTYAGIGNYTDIKMEKDIIVKRIYRRVN